MSPDARDGYCAAVPRLIPRQAGDQGNGGYRSGEPTECDPKRTAVWGYALRFNCAAYIHELRRALLAPCACLSSHPRAKRHQPITPFIGEQRDYVVPVLPWIP